MADERRPADASLVASYTTVILRLEDKRWEMSPEAARRFAAQLVRLAEIVEARMRGGAPRSPSPRGHLRRVK